MRSVGNEQRKAGGFPRRPQRETLYGVIHQVLHPTQQATSSILSVAGRPLLAQQLEWLLGAGCDRVVVEVADDAAGFEAMRWIGQHYALGTDVLLASRGAGGLRELARRVGIASHDALVAIPADTLGDMPVRQLAQASNAYGVVALFHPPQGCESLAGATIRVVRAPMRHGPTMVQGPGWGARVRSAQDAELLSQWIASNARERERVAS